MALIDKFTELDTNVKEKLSEAVNEMVEAFKINKPENEKWYPILPQIDLKNITISDKTINKEYNLYQIAYIFNNDERDIPVMIGHPSNDSRPCAWVDKIKVEVNEKDTHIAYARFINISEELDKILINKEYSAIAVALYPDFSLRHLSILTKKPKTEDGCAIKSKSDLLQAAAEPLIKYLAENYHPHVQCTVDSTSVALWEGLISIPHIDKYLVD